MIIGDFTEPTSGKKRGNATFAMSPDSEKQKKKKDDGEDDETGAVKYLDEIVT
jgi:hypothetical protein